MAEPVRWGPFALMVGGLGICCAGLPLLAAALVAGGGAAALLPGILWIGVGIAAMGAGLGVSYLARRPA